jgi:hypothetical protein
VRKVLGGGEHADAEIAKRQIPVLHSERNHQFGDVGRQSSIFKASVQEIPYDYRCARRTSSVVHGEHIGDFGAWFAYEILAAVEDVEESSSGDPR